METLGSGLRYCNFKEKCNNASLTPVLLIVQDEDQRVFAILYGF